MIDGNEARRIASEFLANIVIDVEPENRVIIDTSTREEKFGWIFFWDDRRYVEDPTSTYALCGNLPIVVLRKNGKLLRLPRLPWNNSLDARIQAFTANLVDDL